MNSALLKAALELNCCVVMRALLIAKASSLLLVAVTVLSVEPSVNETAARIWIEDLDRQLGAVYQKSAEASWSDAVNITAESGRRVVEARVKTAEFFRRKRAEMRRLFRWWNFTDANLTRLFDKADDIGVSAANDTMQELIGNLSNAMSVKFSTAKVKHPLTGKMIPMEPDIAKEMADPVQSEPVKRALWQAWRDASGKQMRQNYTDFVSVSNAMIREAGHKNLPKYWQSAYEPRPGQDFEKMMEDLWNTVKPFYQQLHAYVRRKLRQKYGAHLFPPGGHIPAHILGDMWALGWAEVLQLTTPFPGLKTLDVTEEMQRRGWNVTKMVKISEEFFTSLGLDKMTDTFWQKSVFERIPNVEMDCQASAWNFYSNTGDFRIKQCTSVNMQYLGITHYGMGNIQYYQQYEKQPVLYREGANPGFLVAIGDTLQMAALTPEHLTTIGLLNGTIDSADYYLNYLFKTALDGVAFLPFGYLVDQWRWRVFDGTVGPERYNEFWWQLRCGLQGVASPVRRSAEDFDPGALYHVPNNVEYMKYFVSYVLQFQFYESLCNIAGHKGPLYRCDFHGNKKAGAALKRMMSHGTSLHWEDALEELTGGRELSARPLMRYFSKLVAFLEAENAKSGERIGWDEVCPADSWYSSGGSAGDGFGENVMG